MAKRLRFPFVKANRIAESYSQSWQDIFVLSMLEGMRGGRYLEVGAQEPIANSNTYVLHHNFGWSGVSLELDPSHLHKWRRDRPASNLVIVDALTVDYADALQKWFSAPQKPWFLPKWFEKATDSSRIDYLQLDIDPSSNTLSVLERLPLDRHRFSVITFETDAYTGDLRARDESREILTRHGYELVAKDVAVLFTPVSPEPIPFEDWWVDPQVVDREKIATLQKLNETTCLPQELLLI